MNIVERQIQTAREVAAINRDAARELLRLSASGLEHYMALNADYFKALPNPGSVQGFVEIHRDYAQRFASGIADDFKRRGDVLRESAERTAEVLRSSWDQTGDAIEDRIDELGSSTRSAAEQARRKLHSVADKTRETIDEHLEQISGVGEAYAEDLRTAGVVSFAQLAALNIDDLEDEDHPLHHLKGRMENDEWIKQARERLQLA